MLSTDADEFREVDLLGETHLPEVRGMDLEDQCGLGSDRAAIVRATRAVRRADLDEPSTRRRDDLGQPEGPTDLDQLATADDDLLTSAQGRNGEQQRCGAVVHHMRGLGAEQATREVGSMSSP